MKTRVMLALSLLSLSLSACVVVPSPVAMRSGVLVDVPAPIYVAPPVYVRPALGWVWYHPFRGYRSSHGYRRGFHHGWRG